MVRYAGAIVTLLMDRAESEADRRQRIAADPMHSAWVGASAGTGKTKVLSDRVLNLLLDGAPPERLLCLTYTRAAAAEMSTRLAQTLAQWASMPEPALVQALAERSGAPPSGERLRAARRLFAQVLDAPGGLRIQTIHGFCQSLLARFPLEARLAPHFRVAEEATAMALLLEARRILFARAGAGARPDIATALDEVAVLANEEEFAELVGQAIAERGRFARARRRHGGLEGLIAAVNRLLEVTSGMTHDRAIALACEDSAFDGAALKAAAAALAAGSARDRERGQVIADWLAAPALRVQELSAYRGCFFTKSNKIRKSLVTRAASAPGAEEALAAEAERLSRLDDLCGRIAVARASAALHRLADAILAEYRRLKDERALLDYDDLILYARDLLLRTEFAPWVLYKLDGGIDHILIDEAQDTNPEQWELVAALAEEFFAGAGARTVERTVFAVGDVKQSIFSFQRADPVAFQRMRAHFAQRIRAADAVFAEVPLTKSFRSAPAVLAAVDAVFARSPAGDGVVPDGELLEHQPHRAGAAGLVELWPLPPREEGERSQPWQPPVGRRFERKPRQRLIKLLARRIRALTSGAEILEARGRPILPGDIMVLVRRRGDFVDLLVKELKAEGVPVAGLDRMVLMNQLAIQDLVAFGEALLHPQDDLTLATVLKGPLIGVDEDQLFELAAGRTGRLWPTLLARAEAEPEYQFAADLLRHFLARSDFLRPFELYAELLGPFGGRRKLLERLGPEAGDPLEEFLSRALAFEREHAASLQGFLAWLADGEIEIKRELDRGSGQVRIMTVHGAKGLQAPVVILPDTTQLPNQKRPLLWRKEDDLCLWAISKKQDGAITGAARAAAEKADAEEHRRLLYVAMTRAEDRLIVCGWPSQGGDAAEGSWYDLIRAGLRDISEPSTFDFTAEGGWIGPGFAHSSPQTDPVEAGSTPAASAAVVEPPVWLDRPAPEEPDPPRPLAPSRPAVQEPPVRSPLGPDRGRAFRRGRLVHRLLETLPELPAGARSEAARRFLELAAGDLGAEERDALAGETLAVLDHPDFAALWGPNSLAEVPVVGRIGAVSVAGRIDRLVAERARVTILDYKTNRPPPTDPASVPRAYLDQMAAYRAALSRIYPDAEIRCVLLWTDGPRLMELPGALIDRTSP
ncbi:MAG TPA: double-strand break repair helicase AddA [Alphaproteobacteria bacterium]|nr:double-strand break repair helicase AddA [Alphaproteobacteria bacterium]